MKISSLLRSRFFLIMLCVTSVVSLQAQTVSRLLTDTVSEDVANKRRSDFHKDKPKVSVNYDAQKLRDILDYCLNKGITNVQFVFATIRSDDTTQYFQKHNVAKRDRGSLVGKPTIMLKVPRSAFNLALNADPANNENIKNIVRGGPVLLSKPYGDYVPYASAYLYFDLGTVCPPPDNACD